MVRSEQCDHELAIELVPVAESGAATSGPFGSVLAYVAQPLCPATLRVPQQNRDEASRMIPRGASSGWRYREERVCNKVAHRTVPWYDGEDQSTDWSEAAEKERYT